MKVEVWIGSVSVTVVTWDDPNKKVLVDEDAKLVRTIEGENWEDCMIQHHRLMGWEEYIPFDKK